MATKPTDILWLIRVYFNEIFVCGYKLKVMIFMANKMCWERDCLELTGGNPKTRN